MTLIEPTEDVIWSRRRKALVCFVMTLILIPTAVAFADNDDQDGLPPGVVREDRAAAFAHDVGLMAEQSDLPIDEVERSLAFQDAFTIYGMEVLLPSYEDQISAIWVDPAPATRGYVQFVEEIPQSVKTEASQRGLDIVFTGSGEISMAEHTLRSELAADALVAAGYQNFLTYSDRKEKVIKVEFQISKDAPQPSATELVNLVQDYVSAYGSLLDGRAAEIRSSDVILTVIAGSGPIVEFQHSRGGNRVLDSIDNSACTSGWSVSGPDGDGIVTAGHCSGLDTFVEANGSMYGMVMQYQALYSMGDVEYHTTPTHADLAEFYVTATTIRDVTLVRPTNMMVGHGICFYGRSSNARTCDHTVEAINVTVNTASGTVKKQARATNNSSVSGDSGGGWSTNTWAWGVHSSHQGSGQNAYFTPAEETEDALGVTIKTQ